MDQIKNLQFHAVFFEFKQSLLLSFPLMLSQLVQASSTFVGTLMVAHLGSDALAASAFVSSIFITLCVFSFGVFAAVSVMVSQNFGANNANGIRLAVSQGFILAFYFQHSIDDDYVVCANRFTLECS